MVLLRFSLLVHTPAATTFINDYGTAELLIASPHSAATHFTRECSTAELLIASPHSAATHFTRECSTAELLIASPHSAVTTFTHDHGTAELLTTSPHSAEKKRSPNIIELLSFCDFVFMALRSILIGSVLALESSDLSAC